MKTFNRERKNVEKSKMGNLQNYLYLICSKFYAMIGYANHSIIIFFNIDLMLEMREKW